MEWTWLIKEGIDLVKQFKLFDLFNKKRNNLTLEVKSINLKTDDEDKNKYYFYIDMILRNIGKEKIGIKKIEIWYYTKKAKTEKRAKFFPIKRDFYIQGQESEDLYGVFPIKFENLPSKILFEVILIDYQDKSYTLLVETQPREINGQYSSGFSIIQKLKPTKFEYKDTFGFN